MHKTKLRNASIIGMLFVGILYQTFAYAQQSMPKGLMLNLEFQAVEMGLIPNKSLYPLYVPLGDLRIEPVEFQRALILSSDQGINIPHSSLLDPDGSEWIVTVRVYAVSDGLILSQEDDEHGYAIYLKDGAAHAVFRTGTSAVDLSEDPERGITNCKRNWTVIELRITKDVAWLTLNRNRVAMIRLQEPLQGECMRIRMGNHTKIPTIMDHHPDAQSAGFTGAVSYLRIWRQ